MIHMDLDQLVAKFDDDNEASNIDIVSEYLEQIQEDDENFMQLLTEKLHNAIVYWEQPWYQQAKKLGHRHEDLGDDETVSYRTDFISKEERDLIAKNWRKLRKKFKIPDEIVRFARWKTLGKTRNPKQSVQEQVRRYVISFLARGLKRNTHQIFRHIKSYYGGYRRGRYSAAEEKIIEICFRHNLKPLGRILSTILGREPRCVNKRLHSLRHGKREKKKVKWDLTRATKLLQDILKYSELELEELKDRKIDTWVWHKVAEDMDHNDIYLQQFWYGNLHVQLFVKCDVKLNKLKKNIFKMIRNKAREKEYQVWSDIRWNAISRDFPEGITANFLYRIGRNVVKALKGYLTAPLENVAEYALEKIRNAKKRNKRLRRLRLNKEGHLEVVDYKS